MRMWIIHTRKHKRFLTNTQLEYMYIRAKELYRTDGANGRISIVAVANTMGISISEASHRIRLKLENLDSVSI